MLVTDTQTVQKGSFQGVNVGVGVDGCGWGVVVGVRVGVGWLWWRVAAVVRWL